MVDIKTLLPELKKLVPDLSEDLLARSTSDAKIDAGLREAFQQIEKGGRTAQAFEVWQEDYLDQVAVAWVLACVFVRFMEDNHFIDECWLAGEGERRRLAEDTHELFFRQHPHDTDREYFQHVFKEVGKIPAARDLFAEGRTPLWAVAPSGDAAMSLLKFWREIDAESGQLKRLFQVENGDTRFLGDLYQELSEKAKKKYALLQTPVFVEEFILDRTLTPAIAEFGLEKVRMIDPTCGSGHFLLGGFARLFDLWGQREGNEIKAAQKALDGVWGVDINPFAVAIARFRLIVAAVQACGIKRLKQAPGWNIHLASGDSLLFGSKPSFGGERVAIAQQLSLFEVPAIYAVEDRKTLQQILGQGYHVVVGNPPYITVKDKAQSEAYRQLYSTCHRQYSLGVPFTQRFWELAIQKGEGGSVEAGHIGMITANSYMKREFGKKLIEEFFPKIDLTHVIDTSGAYIPGHGTPTVILLGRNQKPVGDTVRAVLGIKGEPSTPGDASQGLVWQSIVKQIDLANSQDDFTSTGDVPRTTFACHPWSIGGGGAADLRERLELENETTLGLLNCDIGFLVITGEDNCLVLENDVPPRVGLKHVMPLILGDEVRDWRLCSSLVCLWPNDPHGNRLKTDEIIEHLAFSWPYRITLQDRKAFGVPVERKGIPWWALRELYSQRLRTPLCITFAFVATHNHFVLDRGGKVFKQSAPIIKLPAMMVEPRPLGSGASGPLPDGRGSRPVTEDDHLALLGLLNSSTACFWMKQTFHNKGSTVDQHGARQRTAPFEDFYEFTGTGLQRFPLPESCPVNISRQLDELARRYSSHLPDPVVQAAIPTADRIQHARNAAHSIRGQMIALQEELDWECYRLYGLIEEDLSAHPTDSSRDREGAVGSSNVTDQEDHSLTVAARTVAPGPVLLDQDWKSARRAISKAETEPQSYFITFTCYGTWLHGDERGSVDREHNAWQSPPLEPDEERERREFALLKHSPVKLGPKQRLITHHTIEEVCEYRGWRLHALNVRTNHVHVVVTANRRGKRVYNDFKSYATRRMKEAGCLPEACLEVWEEDRFLTGAARDAVFPNDSSRDRQGAVPSGSEPEFKVWTRGGSARPITTDNSFRRAIEYTLHEQGSDITRGISNQESSRDRQGVVGSSNVTGPEDHSLTVAAPQLVLGQRAFEIVMARQITTGELETTWFERHGSTPITEIPSHWPAAYRKLVERRIKVIETNKEVALVEKPEFKRRWNDEPWEEQEQRALKNWLLDRLETTKYLKGTKEHLELTTTAQMADVASADAEYLQVAALYRGRADFDVAALVAELVEGESVPFLPILRYKPSGLRKREVWERTWDLQRQQDAGNDVGDIPVPPKYATADFLKTDYWRLRGKLDVPKERWISYPHCETESDPSLVVGWAGWDHLQQATALVAYYDARKREGWDAKRLTPLLAGLDQLLPWIHQWHPDVDPEFGETAGQSFQTMLEHDAHELGLTLEDIRNWTPPEKKGGRRKAKG